MLLLMTPSNKLQVPVLQAAEGSVLRAWVTVFVMGEVEEVVSAEAEVQAPFLLLLRMVFRHARVEVQGLKRGGVSRGKVVDKMEEVKEKVLFPCRQLVVRGRRHPLK